MILCLTGWGHKLLPWQRRCINSPQLPHLVQRTSVEISQGVPVSGPRHWNILVSDELLGFGDSGVGSDSGYFGGNSDSGNSVGDNLWPCDQTGYKSDKWGYPGHPIVVVVGAFCTGSWVLCGGQTQLG